MSIENVMDRIIECGTGTTYYHIKNAEGKEWVMPARHMRTALELYQPSGRNGKLLKRWLPWGHRIPIVRRVAHARQITCRLSNELMSLLEKTFGTGELEFAVFCGTPSVHQKVTMQVSKEDEILGYCKLTDNDEVAALFRKETETLRWLADKGLEGAPLAIYCGKLTCGVYLFIQTTVKTRRSVVMHEWGPLHEEFMQRLCEATKTTLPYEQTDYYQTMKRLAEHLEWLPKEVDRNGMRRAYALVNERWNGRKVEFAAYHADFTPWNMFAEGKRLFVFDWEYCRRSYPPGMDRYHYFTQTALFERHWTTREIVAYMQSAKGDWMDRTLYRAYLVDIIARFTLRERGNVSKEMARRMKQWYELLTEVMR